MQDCRQTFLCGGAGPCSLPPQGHSTVLQRHACNCNSLAPPVVRRARPGRRSLAAIAVQAPDAADAGLEGNQQELPFQPPTSPSHSYPQQQQQSQHPAKKHGGNSSSYDLARLLDTWDRAVASRTYNLMTQLQPAPGQGSAPSRSSRQRKARRDARAPRQTADRNPHDPTSSAASGTTPVAAAAAAPTSTSDTPHTPTTQLKSTPATRRLLKTARTAPTTPDATTTTASHTATAPTSSTSPSNATDTPHQPQPQPISNQASRDLTLFKQRRPHPGPSSSSRQQVPMLDRDGAQRRAAVIGVNDILQVVYGSPPAHLKDKTLDEVVQQSHILAVNTSIKVLGKSGNATDVERLLTAALTAGSATTHTWGTTFLALADAGRFELAISHLGRACRQGIDIGPVGASCLVKVAAQQRNLELALDLYYKMAAARVTFNRHTYNCIIHLCGVLGRVHDALDLLTHMKADGENNSECRPDCYTYSALLFAINTSQRWEHLNNVFFSLLEERIDVSFEVWCQIINGAGRAGRTDWAEHYWKAYKSQGVPQLGVFNAYLWSLSKSPEGQLEKALSIYQHMPSQGLQPDSYTYVALLSMMAKWHCSLALVESMLRDIRTNQLQLNTQLGTALLNAYKRVPELSANAPGVAEIILERADRLMREMVARRLASSKTFTVYATLYILAGRSHVVPRIIEDARMSGCELDSESYHFLHTASGEVGLMDMSDQFKTQRDVLKRQAKQVQKRVKERMQQRAALWAE